MSESLRIDRGLPRTAQVDFKFDGETIIGRAGDTVGAALWAAGKLVLRKSPTLGMPRGMFCAMGSCQECVVSVDGAVRTACNTPIAPGMTVRSVILTSPAA